MKNMGSLIRRLRMERGLSQQALCKGICAVSYLSKIEKDVANPGEEMIRLLLKAVGVEFPLDGAFLAVTQKALDTYFEHIVYMELSGEEREKLHSVREQAQKSPLTDKYTLFLAYEAMEDYRREEAETLLKSLRYREAEMEDRELFFYAMVRGMLANDQEESLAWHRKANRLRPCGFVALQMGECYHRYGAYQAAIDHLQTAYARAADEGSPLILLFAANMTAICYSDLYQKELMLHFFQKAARLAAKIEPEFIPTIHYNIGATLVSMRQSAEALPYLLDAERGGYEDDILLFHKLAIACQDTGDTHAAQTYLCKAEALLAAGKGTPIQQKMIRIVRLRMEENYLASGAYYKLLREVYDEIGVVYHYGFKQFHGNLLMEACVRSRRYKEALCIAAEVKIFPEFMK